MDTIRRLLTTNKLRSIGLHILFWIIIVMYFAWGFGLDVHPMRSIINSLFYMPGHIIMVYSLLYLLVPRFLLKRKFVHFFIGLLIVLQVCILYSNYARLQLSADSDWKIIGFTLNVGRNVLPFFHVAGIALSIKLLKYWFLQRKRTLEAEQRRTAAELKLLKSQLHPHFLFNTLNNLYSHILENSPMAPEIVLKLSNVLRFIVYESNNQRIPLYREIELIQNYIALEQMRYGDRLELSIVIKGDIDEYEIAPLLLLPFVENAFKHGISKQIEDCWISLHLEVRNSVMYFKLLNSVDTQESIKNKNKKGGIGLENVKRRLELLYQDKFHFEPLSYKELYIIILEVTLDKNTKPLAEEFSRDLKVAGIN